MMNMQPENISTDLYTPQGVSDEIPPTQTQGVEWQASEYIHHEKQTVWFVVLFAIAIVLLIVAIFVVQSITFSILIVAMTVAIAVYAVRQPRIMNYALSLDGLQINEKFFHLNEFRSFGIIQDGPLFSALLIPNKRFMPAVTVYFAEESGEQIVDILGLRLPMQHVELDPVDKLVRRLRF